MRGLFRTRRVVGLSIAAAAVVLVACGGGGPGEGADSASDSRQFIDTPRIFAITDFESVGFKKSKEYDVEGLDNARSVWLGFWGPSASDRTDFELRFYDSHADAVSVGAPLADEATGDLFRERKDSQTWTVGEKDRWRASSATGITTRDSGASIGPVYADFAIFGNVILLCEGANSEQSLERCEHLIDALTEGPAA